MAGDLNEIHITLPLPKDSDGDGITDDLDACPQVPGVPNKDPNLNGCPIPKNAGNITILNIFERATTYKTYVIFHYFPVLGPPHTSL